MTAQAANVRGPGTTGRASRPLGRGRRARLVIAVFAVLVLLTALRTLVVQVFVIPSTSMEPTLLVGDRVAVSRWDQHSPRRGDVVVFDGTGLFAPLSAARGPVRRAADRVTELVGKSSRRMFVKRVVGLPGERVRCCTADGRITIDGRPLAEPWLPPGTAPSRTTFDVRVPADHYWVMGDNRDVSADSRAHLGSPGGGTVPLARIVGPVVGVVWPPSRWGDPPGGVAAP